MATPKGLPGVSTPKNPLTSTPTRPVASPRPNSGVLAGKTLAYKSPAVKTSSSLHGHSQRLSISSHPTSTPQAAPAIHDELLNLNSPAAALIASIGNTGLTPIATGQDGLGITTGIIAPNARGLPVGTPKNPEAERQSRLEQVARLLEPQTAGRGITREGVERIAQIHNFTILWDDDNLTIAGNRVDLEIVFDASDRDVVRDVQLRLNTSTSEDPQLQKDASEVLKQHLLPRGQIQSTSEAWVTLKDFAEDLQYLSHLDYADNPTNCFELMNSLYLAFRKIWDEEKKRMRDNHEAHRMCRGNVGRPFIDSIGRLGVTTQYWVSRQHYQALTSSADGSSLVPANIRMAKFSCSKGSPGITSSSGWLDDPPLTTTTTTEDMFEESQVGKPNWTDSTPFKDLDAQQKEVDAMLIDGPEKSVVGSLNLVFECSFDDTILIPIDKTTEFNRHFPMVAIEQSKPVIYQQALLTAAEPTATEGWSSHMRWAKHAVVYDEQGHASTKTHSLSLTSRGVAWVCPVDVLRFSHPKQYADVLPLLRQYTLLWSILRNSVGDTAGNHLHEPALNMGSTEVKHTLKAGVRKRSNKKAAQDELEDLLSGTVHHDAALRIDMSLDLLSDPSRAKLDIILPILRRRAEGPSEQFLHITIEIRPNGLIDIPTIRGVGAKDEGKLRQRAVKVLGLSEDVSVLVEWLLGEVGKNSM